MTEVGQLFNYKNINYNGNNFSFANNECKTVYPEFAQELMD